VAARQERVHDRPTVDPAERGPARGRGLREESSQRGAAEGRVPEVVRLLQPAPRLLGGLQRDLQLQQRGTKQRLDCLLEGLLGRLSPPDHAVETPAAPPAPRPSL
jgi:hypothetical protein